VVKGQELAQLSEVAPHGAAQIHFAQAGGVQESCAVLHALCREFELSYSFIRSLSIKLISRWSADFAYIL
jgi:hypothetical protein